MSELMSEQSACRAGARSTSARSENDVAADGVGLRPEGSRRACSLVACVNADPAEIESPPRLEVVTVRGGKGLAGPRASRPAAIRRRTARRHRAPMAMGSQDAGGRPIRLELESIARSVRVLEMLQPHRADGTQWRKRRIRLPMASLRTPLDVTNRYAESHRTSQSNGGASRQRHGADADAPGISLHTPPSTPAHFGPG